MFIMLEFSGYEKLESSGLNSTEVIAPNVSFWMALDME